MEGFYIFLVYLPGGVIAKELLFSQLNDNTISHYCKGALEVLVKFQKKIIPPVSRMGRILGKHVHSIPETIITYHDLIDKRRNSLITNYRNDVIGNKLLFGQYDLTKARLIYPHLYLSASHYLPLMIPRRTFASVPPFIFRRGSSSLSNG